MAIFKKASVTPIVRSVISAGILDDEHGYNFEMHPEDFKEVEDSWHKYLSSGIGKFNSELTSMMYEYEENPEIIQVLQKIRALAKECF